MERILLEAVTATMDEVMAATAGGVDRIELCEALPTGGVTPSIGMLEEALECCDLPIVTMVRPREGNPTFSNADLKCAVRDVTRCADAGSHEIIFGVLDSANRIDMAMNRELIAAAQGRPVVFHRVFDMIPDLDEGLEQLIELGFSRLLTSGGADNVDLGMDRLSSLLTRAAGRITILPGGGVRPHNAKRLVEIGCKELHFSFRKLSGKPGYSGIEDTLPDIERALEMRRLVS
ncbi:MAG: copper homeostasis protein CutC [Armatimonadetes bacterium]|nr:copper homeostasis protein CutC [Armatimonadota bacterium]